MTYFIDPLGEIYDYPLKCFPSLLVILVTQVTCEIPPVKLYNF